MANIFIIIPAYNEAASIARVIRYVSAADKSWRIVVVDDCSTDDTVKLARTAGAVVLTHIINRGQGAALKTGTEYAIIKGADIIVHFDADGQFIANEIKNIITPIIDNKADIVFGSRFLTQKSNVPWFKKYVILALARLINKIFLGVNLSDPQAGFRAMARSAAKKLNWRQDRMAHCSEIMHLASKNKLRAQEVPITIIYHDFGQRFSGGVRILKEFFLGIFTG
ncbi:MAG: glycosyltransferase family 2 protein [Patescibacteria group bacterium]